MEHTPWINNKVVFRITPIDFIVIAAYGGFPKHIKESERNKYLVMKAQHAAFIINYRIKKKRLGGIEK